MEYEDIYKPLSRTSFDSKMAQAFQASIQTMSVNGQIDSEELRNKCLPDEIETFVLNCVDVKEYDNKQLSNKQFADIINAIRNFQPPEFQKRLHKDFLKWVLPTIGAVQFESQQYLLFRLYRHHCLFSFKNEIVNVENEFEDKFQKSFDEYACIAYSIHLLLSQKKLQAFKAYCTILQLEEPWFIDNLTISRDQYKEELSQFTKSKADYRYCLRPSYSYPFIDYKEKIYLPTPHLLMYSITTGMMNRLTFGNTDLRQKIGKHACENYLFSIVSDSNLFDEVYSEYEYKKGKMTIDIMARKGSMSLLMDSKLFSPKVSLRTYDEDAYKKDTERIVEAIRQAYIHAHDKFRTEYDPFSSIVEETYALVVAYQDGYNDLGEIYSEVARSFSIDEGSEEFEWLWHHIGFTDLSNVERFMLTRTDVFPTLLNRNEISDIWLAGNTGNDFSNEFLKYMDGLKNSITESESFIKSYSDA